jgi:carboxypeptidase family protein
LRSPSIVCATMVALIELGAAGQAQAQTSGSVVGRVIDAQTRTPLAGVTIRLLAPAKATFSLEDGRFVIGAVPPGERAVRAERIGYQSLTIENVPVRAGRSAEVTFELSATAVTVPGVVVQADRVRLIEPEISSTHEVIVAREIRDLPIDRLQEIIELTTGVSEGHFRGGRVGQEVYVIDGLVLKNQFEASSQGFGLELSPTSLEEVDVITGGFGAAFGSALSGVVSYATRRGNPERWESRAAFTTDHWAPGSLLRGYAGLSASIGGPLPMLGRGTTVFADVLAQGLLDAEPRADGLTCLAPEQAEPDLAGAIRALQSDPVTSHLVCPYRSAQLPHQRGDKYIAFLRFDRPLREGLDLTASLVRNRFQRQLYTAEFKYNPEHQLGQRSMGTLANVSLEWLRQQAGSARSLTGRVALLRLDRYLGVIDPASLNNRLELGGFGPEAFNFLGEDHVRRPIEDQLANNIAVPGYSAPGGVTGSPFGPAGAGIFYTSGTPGLANWTRSDLLTTELNGSYFTPTGSAFRAGASAKLYRVETYERAFAYLAGSIPNFARFFPATYSGFAEADIETVDGMHFQFGVRLDAFRSGINFRFDRANFLAPTIETGWKVSLIPRVGAAFPVPGTDGRTAVRFNFGRVSQPPDFQYFLDSTIGDSLRTDLRRQGNPDLAFEKGNSYEAGISHLMNDHVSVGLTAFRKSLENLVTGSVYAGGLGTSGIFTTSDYGTVKGVELSMRARWPGLSARASWALQKATGLTSGLDTDSARNADPAFTEYPLAFDRRHSFDLTLTTGRAGGADKRWSGVLTANAQSGYPLLAIQDPPPSNPLLPPPPLVREPVRYLPWTWTADLRASWDFGVARVCSHCRWRAIADGRNIFNKKNIIALRRENGALAPTFSQVQGLVDGLANLTEPIPRESPSYSSRIDLDHDGMINNTEYRTARLAAALDRFDPSLFFGEARQLRLGIEVVF